MDDTYYSTFETLIRFGDKPYSEIKGKIEKAYKANRISKDEMDRLLKMYEEDD